MLINATLNVLTVFSGIVYSTVLWCIQGFELFCLPHLHVVHYQECIYVVIYTCNNVYSCTCMHAHNYTTVHGYVSQEEV